MRIPVRIIGVATSIFWAFLIIFSASAMYSMKDVQFNLGQPQISTSEDSQTLISFPLHIVNTGLYNIADFNFSTKVFNTEGSDIAEGSTIIPMIAQGQAMNTTHNMKLNLTGLLHTDQGLLFNDSELEVNETASMRVAEVIPVQASSFLSLPWGAPLYNLAFGTPEYTMYNATHMRVVIPVSFENHAFFDLAGTVKVQMFSNTYVAVAGGETDVEALQNSAYHGNLQLYTPSRAIFRPRFEVLFITPFFKYGPMVIEYGN